MSWLDWLMGPPPVTLVKVDPATVGPIATTPAETVKEVDYHLARFSAALDQGTGDDADLRAHLAYWTAIKAAMDRRPA